MALIKYMEKWHLTSNSSNNAHFIMHKLSINLIATMHFGA